MPIYEYQCPECDAIFEEWQSGFDEVDRECPQCGALSKRLISHTSFVLKGGGWYVTDYAGKKPSDPPADTAGPDNGNGNGNGNGKGETAKAGKESKAEPKAAPAGTSANSTAS